ncbi:tRNA binding protein [Aureococcus anophagefferens]|uniref:tRNA binding protein n=1 Tax=Aureococcus anophagefferens TaxID=44056 RepID=A0ABR1G9G0_AURAN
MLKSMLSLTLALRSAALVPRVAQHPRRATIRMMSDEKVADFSKIDLRVGTIVSAWNHPDSDKLIVEEIDIGEDEPRQIVSGLRAFYEADALARQEANQVKKKKFWPPVAEKLAMAGGVATFDGQAISTSEGPCTCPSIAEGGLS